MAHCLEHVHEPERLFLAWQEPDAPGSNRTRWAVGTLLRDGDEATLTYFERGEEFENLNLGKTFEQLKVAGYNGYPAFNLKQRHHRAGVMEAFMRRLPPRGRADFKAYEAHFGISAYLDVSDFTLLGITQAKLPNDGFSLVDPLEGEILSHDMLLEVAGYRHYVQSLPGRPEVGDPVQLVALPHATDPKAIVIFTKGEKIGNINRLQTTPFAYWLANRMVNAWIERINGKPEHPRAHIFVRIRPQHAQAA